MPILSSVFARKVTTEDNVTHHVKMSARSAKKTINIDVGDVHVAIEILIIPVYVRPNMRKGTRMENVSAQKRVRQLKDTTRVNVSVITDTG